MLPDHVGFPMGEAHGGSTYYLMEMHYDNPNLEKGEWRKWRMKVRMEMRDGDAEEYG